MQKRQLHSLKQKLASKLYPLALLKNKNKINKIINKIFGGAINGSFSRNWFT